MQQFPSLEQTKKDDWIETMFSPTNGGTVPNGNGVINRYVVSDGNTRVYKSTLSGTPLAILSWEEATRLAEIVKAMGDKAVIFRLEAM